MSDDSPELKNSNKREEAKNWAGWFHMATELFIVAFVFITFFVAVNPKFIGSQFSTPFQVMLLFCEIGVHVLTPVVIFFAIVAQRTFKLEVAV